MLKVILEGIKMFKSGWSSKVSVIVLAGVLVGCSLSPNKPSQLPPEQVYSQRMAEADALVASGNREAAVMAYEQLANDNPTKGEPWAKVAQLNFSQGNYSQAIVAAEETLKRDPSNRQAKSVMAVGGLRLAVRSLEELRNDSELAGDAKSDAQKLAEMLRETLGESVLAPVAEPKPQSKKRQVRRRAPAAAPAAPAARSSGTTSNPFGALQ